MPGKSPGPSIKNPATYEALKRKGLSKSSAAAISNAALNKGYRKGKAKRDEADGASIEWLTRDRRTTTIKTKSDLRDAIKAFGRAKNKAAAKANIKKRARALGATDMLPENWDASVDFNDEAERLFDAWIETDDAKACPDCGGDGLDDDDEICPTCNGEGYVGLPASLEDEDSEDEDDCGPGMMRKKRKPAKDSLFFDSIPMEIEDGSTLRKTRDGYLVASARIARTGIQEYGGYEVGVPDMETVRIYRPPEEVFSTETMTSLAHKPITLHHPPEMVDASNWDRYAIGHIGDEVTRDGHTIRVPMVIMDAKAIKAYEQDGVRELSVGYSTELKWTPGITPQGERYDAVQTAIRGNHLAVVPAARGGSQLRLGDEEGDNAMTIRVLIDGQGIEFANEAGAAQVQKYIAGLEDAAKKGKAAEEEMESEKKERGEKDAAFAALKGENVALKKQLDDALAKFNPASIDALVKERIDLLTKADAALEGKGNLDGKDPAQIRREVVMAKMGDAAKDLTDAEMVGAFKAVTANIKPRTGTDRLSDTLGLLGQGAGSNLNDPKAIRDAAYDAYVKRLSGDWKKHRGGAAA